MGGKIQDRDGWHDLSGVPLARLGAEEGEVSPIFGRGGWVGGGGCRQQPHRLPLLSTRFNRFFVLFRFPFRCSQSQQTCTAESALKIQGSSLQLECRRPGGRFIPRRAICLSCPSAPRLFYRLRSPLRGRENNRHHAVSRALVAAGRDRALPLPGGLLEGALESRDPFPLRLEHLGGGISAGGKWLPVPFPDGD